LKISADGRDILLALVSFATGFAAFVFLDVWAGVLPRLFGNAALTDGWAFFSSLFGVFMGCLYFSKRAHSTVSPGRMFYLSALSFGIAGIPVWQLVRMTSGAPSALMDAGISSPWALTIILAAMTLCILFVPGFVFGGFLTYGIIRANGRRDPNPAARLLWPLFLGLGAGAVILVFVLIPRLNGIAPVVIAAGAAAVPGAVGIARQKGSAAGETVSNRTYTGGSGIAGTLAPLVTVFQTLYIFATVTWMVTWFRLCLMAAGPSIQVFAALLIAVLGGIAAGSAIMTRSGARQLDLAVAAGVLSGAMGVLLLLVDRWAAALPALFLESIGTPPLVWSGLVSGYFRLAFGTVFAPALLLGMSIGVFADVPESVGSRWIGSAFSRITLGVLAAILLTRFVPGEHLSARMLAVGSPWICVVSSLVFLATDRHAWAVRLAWVFPVAAAVVLTATQPRWTFGLFSRGVYVMPVEFKRVADLRRSPPDMDFLFFQDDRDNLVSVERAPDALTLRVNGSVRASAESGMVPHLLTGHIPLLLEEGPQRIFLGGLDAGLTLRSIEAYPVSEIHCAEPSAAVVRAAALFSAFNRDALGDARLHVSVRDIGNDLLYSTDRYDVIILKSPLPYSCSSAGRLTADFFDLVRSRLAPGGIACQQVSTFDFSLTSLKSLATTFASFFPNVSVWWAGADKILLLGSSMPVRFPEEDVRDRMSLPQVGSELARLGMTDPLGILSCFMMERENLLGFSGGADMFTSNCARLALDWPQRSLELVKTDCLAGLSAASENPVVLLTGMDHSSADYKMLSDQLARCRTAYGSFVESVAYLREGRIREAVGRLDDAPELCPLNGIYVQTLADYYVLLSRSLLSAGRTEEAVEEARRSVELMPASPRTYYNLASIELTRDPATAIALLDRAVHLNPYYVPAYLLKAKAQLASGEAKDAAGTVGDVLTMEPFNVDAHHLRALSLIDRRLYSEARGELQMVLEARPDDLEALEALAYDWLLDDGLDEAARLYRRILKLSPDHLGALNNYATILAEQGRYRDAVRIWTKALELSPGNQDIMDNIQDARAQMRR
jgi:spermidine synthase